MTPLPAAASRAAWDAAVSDPSDTLLAFDFDGTLAPIRDDPEAAYVHPQVLPVLARLSGCGARLAIVTGRPVRSVVRLGGLRDTAGLERLVVLGQYGVERWDAETDVFHEPPEPAGMALLREQLPALLTGLGLGEAHVEDKGRAIGVHLRRMPRPQQAYDRLALPLRELAAELDLAVEPGRQVIELRAPGMDKGLALGALVDELGVATVLFAGDDLGDLPAFDALQRWRESGAVRGLRICSASTEQAAIAEHADVVVDGPDGLVELLSRLAADAGC